MLFIHLLKLPNVPDLIPILTRSAPNPYVDKVGYINAVIDKHPHRGPEFVKLREGSSHWQGDAVVEHSNGEDAEPAVVDLR